MAGATSSAHILASQNKPSHIVQLHTLGCMWMYLVTQQQHGNISGTWRVTVRAALSPGIVLSCAQVNSVLLQIDDTWALAFTGQVPIAAALQIAGAAASSSASSTGLGQFLLVKPTLDAIQKLRVRSHVTTSPITPSDIAVNIWHTTRDARSCARISCVL